MTPMNHNLFDFVFALQARESHKWVFETVLSSLDDIHQIILPYIRDYAEVRFVALGVNYSGISLPERIIERIAAQRGWRADGEYWVPLEIPLRLPPPTPDTKTTDVTFTLKQILFGSMVVEVLVGTQRIELVFDDAKDNLVFLVRFIQTLVDGGTPHAAIADSTLCNFIVDEGPSPNKCRLIIRSDYPERKATIDVFTSRLALAVNFCALAHAIGRHTHFAHHFLFNCCLPSEAVERIARVHEGYWADCVQRGIYSDDDDDVERELLGARIVLDLQLPLDWTEETVQYKKMMNTLVIPRDWQIKFGLAPLVTKEDIDCIIDSPKPRQVSDVANARGRRQPSH